MLNKDKYHEDNLRTFCCVCGTEIGPMYSIGSWFMCPFCLEKLNIEEGISKKDKDTKSKGGDKHEQHEQHDR